MTRLKDSLPAPVDFTLRPLHNKVILEKEETDEYYGKIVVPSKTMGQIKPCIGKVLAVGPDVDEEQLRPGDRVTYGEPLASEMKVGADSVWLIEFEALVAVLEPK